jgi:hypothetical protein
MSVSRKVLLTLGILMLLAVGLGFGSFATFNAETDNPGNVFAHGTLVLSNTKQGGTACLSTGGGSTDTNVNPNCDQLFNLTVKKPGDSGTANLTLKNAGSLDASSFVVFSPSCTPADAAGESYHGTGNPCSTVQLYIQQWSDAAFTTPLACVYGGATGSTCNFSDTSKTLGSFAATYSSSAAGLSLGGLTKGSSAYFTIGVKSPSSTGNNQQGRQATQNFDWYIAQ